MGIAICVLFFTIAPRFGDLIIGYSKSNEGCTVTHIVDGDTVTLKCIGEPEERARLLGFDTPEMDANCASEWVMAVRAKWTLRWAIWTTNSLIVEKNGRDRYSRALIDLILDGRNVSQMMIEKGHARPYKGGRREIWCDT